MNPLILLSLSKSFELKRWLLPIICLILVSMTTKAQVPSTNGNFTATTPSNLSLQTGATPTTRLTILNSNGNVGIGTTSPTAKLHMVFPGSTDPGNQAIQVEATNPANYSSTLFKNSSGDIGVIGFTGASYNWGMQLPRQAFISSSTPNGIALVSYDPNGIITFGTGGHATTNERVRIDKLGNVGIGKTNPAYPLDVAGTINATNIFTPGNVGIGTTSPAGSPTAKLHIVFPGSGDPSNQAIQVEATNPANYSSTMFKNSSGDIGLIGFTGASYNWGMHLPRQAFINSSTPNGIALVSYDPNGIITFGTGGHATTNERVRIDKLGNVGIGKTNPAYPLDVAGTINSTNIFTSGNVGIGTTSPEGLLHIGTSNLGVGTAKRLLLEPPYHIGAAWQFTVRDDTGSSNLGIGYGAESLTMHHGGNVGIGTNTPNYKLDVAGTINATNILVNGTLGIGTTLTSNPNGYKLAVNGKIGAKDVQVETTSTTWPDYVFAKDYHLPSLTEVEKFIQENKHLENVPSAKEIEKNGHSLGEMDKILLKKVEELTLYVIEQNKTIQKQNERIQNLENVKHK